MMKHLPPNVRFLGIVDREKMNEIYNMADVMFLPSYEELFPMTILESMNCAVPVLVRNLPIYDPILFDYALRGDGMDAFVSTLKQLREDPDFYQRSAHASFAGHEFYSREHVGQMWKEFYEKTAAEGKRTVPARRRDVYKRQRLQHRQQHYAPEEKSGYCGAGARKDRTCLRRPHVHSDDHERHSSGV